MIWDSRRFEEFLKGRRASRDFEELPEVILEWSYDDFKNLQKSRFSIKNHVILAPRSGQNLGHTQTDFNETWSDQSLLTDLKDLRRWSAEDLIGPWTWAFEVVCVRVVFWNPGFRYPAVTESASHHIEPPLTKIMRRIMLWKSHVCPSCSQHKEIVENEVKVGHWWR